MVLFSTQTLALTITSPQNNATYTSSDVFFNIKTDSASTLSFQETGKNKVILCASCVESSSIQTFERGTHTIAVSDKNTAQIIQFEVTQPILTPKLILTQDSGFVYNKKIVAKLVVTEQTGTMVKPDSARISITGDQLDEPINQQMTQNNGYFESSVTLPSEGTYQFDAVTTVQGSTLTTTQVYAYHAQPSLLIYSAAFIINQNKEFTVIRHATYIYNEGIDATNIVVNQKSPKNSLILRLYPQTANQDQIQWLIPIIKQGETISVAYDYQTTQTNTMNLEQAEIILGEQKIVANPVSIAIPKYENSPMSTYKAILDSKVVGNTVTFTTSAYADTDTSATKISISDEDQQKDYSNTKPGIYELTNTVSFDREQVGRNEVLQPATMTMTDAGIRVQSESQPTQIFVPGLTSQKQSIIKTQKLNISPALVMIFIIFGLLITFMVLAKTVPKRQQR